MKICRHLFISGIVQGVCFRHYTKQKADALGVLGWVRNCLDGRVEVMIEGDDYLVAELVSWCNEGPTSAEVRDLQVEDGVCTGEYNGFLIQPLF